MPTEKLLETVIVDSDVRSQRYLYPFLHQDPRVNLVRSMKGGKLFVSSLSRDLVADVAFINPELSDGSAFDLLLRIPKEERPIIVMFNGRLDYAYYAYQIDALDFLNMPFTRPEYDHCIEKVLLERRKRHLYSEWKASQEEEEEKSPQ